MLAAINPVPGLLGKGLNAVVTGYAYRRPCSGGRKGGAGQY